jgi:KipI family sensor histidine kinase inhibitor
MTLRTHEQPMVSMLGTSAMIFEAPGAFDLAHQRRIWSMARTVEAWPDVDEAIPGMTNLMVTFEAPPTDPAALAKRLEEAWSAAGDHEPDSKLLELSVVYGGDGGPHLQDVVAHTGLTLDEVIALHTQAEYVVFAVGSHPGYCYLGGLDHRLATPRRKVPLQSIPGGSVSIGGMQTGISASAGPSGWNTIGLAEAHFFDPQADPPALLSPGDRIRLRAERVIR